MSVKIIAVFPCSEMNVNFEDVSDVVRFHDDDFMFENRVHTEDELESIKKIWDSEPNLLSGEGYINRIRNQEFKLRNPNYPDNYINAIKENLDTCECIIIDISDRILKLLDENEMEYILVYPEDYCKYEWIGRMFNTNHSNSMIKYTDKNWDKIISKMDSLSENHDVIRLSYGQNLSDFLFDKDES